ncbi:MAG: hemolysin III family protein [Treponema sp.]|nr:hemolysin III family protein [Treponema sp.]
MSVKNVSSNAAALPLYSIREEIANSTLHGIGVLGATASMVLLSLKTAGFLSGRGGDAIDIIAVLIYSTAMIGMYLVSTLYHSIQHQGAKMFLRRLDHSIIYVFIAGTYTPFCLIALRGAWGWSIFGVEWFLAILGIALNFLNVKLIKKIEIAFYIIMGWLIVVGFIPLIRAVPVKCVVMLITGGILYTLGVIWYRKKHLKYSHAIWHVFVLAGTVFQWFSVWMLI